MNISSLTEQPISQALLRVLMGNEQIWALSKVPYLNPVPLGGGDGHLRLYNADGSGFYLEVGILPEVRLTDDDRSVSAPVWNSLAATDDGFLYFVPCPYYANAVGQQPPEGNQNPPPKQKPPLKTVYWLDTQNIEHENGNVVKFSGQAQFPSDFGEFIAVSGMCAGSDGKLYLAITSRDPSSGTTPSKNCLFRFSPPKISGTTIADIEFVGQTGEGSVLGALCDFDPADNRIIAQVDRELVKFNKWPLQCSGPNQTFLSGEDYQPLWSGRAAQTGFVAYNHNTGCTQTYFAPQGATPDWNDQGIYKINSAGEIATPPIATWDGDSSNGVRPIAVKRQPRHHRPDSWPKPPKTFHVPPVFGLMHPVGPEIYEILRAAPNQGGKNR